MAHILNVSIVMNTGFYQIFAAKLKKQKAEIKRELERAKTDRRKDWLKKQLRETKELQKTVDKMEDKIDIKNICPHCSEKI